MNAQNAVISGKLQKVKRTNLTKVVIHKKAMIEALTKSLGIVTIACKEVGISRTLHYNWYNEDMEYHKAVDDVADIALDFAESMLHKQIENKDTAATIFYLKTKGKKRGYVERDQIEIFLPELKVQPLSSDEQEKINASLEALNESNADLPEEP